MRFFAFFPLLFAFASFIISLLLLLAGCSPGFLENVDFLTLNTSMIGKGLANGTSSFNMSGISQFQSQLNQLQGQKNASDLNKLQQLNTTGAVGDFAGALNLHDFYSLHLLDYCEGYYTPSPVANASPTPSKKVTYCSSSEALFAFNATEVLQRELKPNVTLAELKWPQEVEDGITAVSTAMKAMFVLYCVAAAFSACAVLGAVFGFLLDGRWSAFANVVFDFIAFLALLVAAAIGTATMMKATDTVNQGGTQIGISATGGQTFKTLSWVATCLMLLASLSWCLSCCIGPGRKGRRSVRDEKGHYIAT